MLEVSNIRVYDLEESVIACRNPMRLSPPEYTKEEFTASLPRAIQLANTPNGSGHSNFLCGIRVAFDIKYPGYISPELQRYHFNDIVSSASKMHKLVKMDMDLCFNKYTSKVMVDEMKRLVNQYNTISNLASDSNFTLRDGSTLYVKYPESQYVAFMQCISSCPYGIELFMRCTTNYLALKTIYHQRKNHKLQEDWQEGFCKNFVEKLPYAKEFIIGEKQED